MAHPLIDGDARLTQVAGAYVVVLGLAVGAVGVAPVVGALLTASALIGAAIARLPRRAAVLGVAPLILAAGVPWPVPAVAAVLASRVVGGPMLTTATARRADQPARSVAEVAVLVAVCVRQPRHWRTTRSATSGRCCRSVAHPCSPSRPS